MRNIVVVGGMQLKTSGSNKAPFSAWHMGRYRKVGEVTTPTRRANPSGLWVPPQPFLPILPEDCLPIELPIEPHFSQALQTPCLVCCFFPRPAQACPPRAPDSPLPPSAYALPHTHRHTPPKQAFAPCFTPLAQFRTSYHLPGADSPPSDRLHQDNKVTSRGQSLGGLCG